MDAVVIVLYVALVVLIIAGMWKAFEKAGQPGWAVLIPFYNVYILTKMAGKPGWWLLLFLVPFVNFVIAIILSVEIARRFGKGTGFGVCLAIFGAVCWPILGFGSAKWQGGGAA
ncbi:MAG: signal peptidase I [Planctomycetes bacterium]|nr:signal peptidase I [Planctomycetota bacterium]